MSQNNAFWLHCKEEAILILRELIYYYMATFLRFLKVISSKTLT